MCIPNTNSFTGSKTTFYVLKSTLFHVLSPIPVFQTPNPNPVLVYFASRCYTPSQLLLHPKSSRDSPSLVTALWAVGLRQVQSSVPSIIMIILFTPLSLNPVPLRISCFQTSLCFMFPFYFAFSFPLFYFRSPNPDPDICPISATLT